MTVVVKFPTAYFPDPNVGRPISNGYVYIGQVGLDPTVLANRITLTLVQEDGSTVSLPPASQPLRTDNGGVFVYNGSPVQVRADEDYSLLVQDRNRVQIYYFPDSNDAPEPLFPTRRWPLTYTDGASGVGLSGTDVATYFKITLTTGDQIITDLYDSNKTLGSGAVFQFTGATNAGKAGNCPDADGYFYDAAGMQFAYSGEKANILCFGGICDGLTNNAPAIRAALESIRPNGGIIFIPSGQCLISEEVVIDASSVLIEGVARNGKMTGNPGGRGSYVLVGANISGSVFRFTKAADSNVLQSNGCGVRNLSFIGANRAYSVESAIYVESSDLFSASSISFERIKGTAIKCYRMVKAKWNDVDIILCGDTGKPAIWFTGTSTSQCTQGSVFTGFSVEFCIGAPYMRIESQDRTNKFIGFGFESDEVDSQYHEEFIHVSGFQNQFIGLHLNTNGGSNYSVRVDGSRNVFDTVKVAGTRNGNVFLITGTELNIISNYVVAFPTSSSLVFAELVTAFNCGFYGGNISNGNGINSDSATRRTCVSGLVHVNKNSYTISDSGSGGIYEALVDNSGIFVASAAALVIPDCRNIVAVTGTTNITSISTQVWDGRTIILQFTDVLTVVDSSGSLRLAGDFVTAPNSTLTLVCRGSVWFEVSRSAN